MPTDLHASDLMDMGEWPGKRIRIEFVNGRPTLDGRILDVFIDLGVLAHDYVTEPPAVRFVPWESVAALTFRRTETPSGPRR